MNKTKIEWTNYTWNPVTGCKHGCWYCYAHKLFTRFHKSFEPTFYPDRLLEPDKLKKPSKIFCCSVADLFAEWTNPGWREAVLQTIETCPWHTFQLLTKNPELIDKNYQFGSWVWVGATITKQDEVWKIDELKKVKAKIKFVSFEPLLESIDCDLSGIDWIIIGKLTGSKKVPLSFFWVERLIKRAQYYNIPVFIKNNVNWHEKIQEFPSPQLLCKQ